MPRKKTETTDSLGNPMVPEILSTAQVVVDGDYVRVTLTNPKDQSEQATFSVRKEKAAAFVVNDMAASILADTKQIRPFEGA
jgi:hypothetical protein